MSSARIGVAPATLCVWSAAHWFTSLRSRCEYVRSTHPEPPPHRLAHGDKLRPPPVNAPEVARERLPERLIRLSFGPQTIEVTLVEDHGVHRDELFALEPIDHEHRRLREVELGKLGGNGVETFHGAAVVVLVVADDELL